MESSWSVLLLAGALRQFQELDEDVRLEVADVLAELEEDPFPFDCIAMEGYADKHRVRCYGGRYRIVYRVLEKTRKVVVERIGPRANVYIGMRRPGGRKKKAAAAEGGSPSA